MADDLLYSEDADQALTALAATAPNGYERVTAALAEFEATRAEARWRRRRYASPPAFGLTVRTTVEVYLVLWSSVDDTVIVEYVGPDI